MSIIRLSNVNHVFFNVRESVLISVRQRSWVPVMFQMAIPMKPNAGSKARQVVKTFTSTIDI